MRKVIMISLLAIVVTVVGTFFIFIAIGYSSRMKTATLRLASYHPKIAKTTLGHVEYELRGEGPLVLVSHGITGGIDQCFSLSKTYLKHEKLRVLAVSRFGYGGSPMPNMTSPAEQADVFAALLDELHIKKVHVFGNSAGAAAAFQFAIRHAEKCLSLILVSSNFPNDAAVPPRPVMQVIFGSNFLYWITIRLFEKGMLRMAGVPAGILSVMDGAKRSSIVDDILLSGLPINTKTKGVLNDLYVSNVDMKKGYDFSKINSPVLLMHAKDDPANNFHWAQNIATQIRDCKFIAIESGGHLLLGSETIVNKMSYDLILSEEKKYSLQTN
jgi:pimeloyl-ACP methyl ester carboxylesterase